MVASTPLAINQTVVSAWWPAWWPGRQIASYIAAANAATAITTNAIITIGRTPLRARTGAVGIASPKKRPQSQRLAELGLTRPHCGHRFAGMARR